MMHVYFFGGIIPHFFFEWNKMKVEEVCLRVVFEQATSARGNLSFFATCCVNYYISLGLLRTHFQPFIMCDLIQIPIYFLEKKKKKGVQEEEECSLC
jgi:hypothetical protein